MELLCRTSTLILLILCQYGCAREPDSTKLSIGESSDATARARVPQSGAGNDRVSKKALPRLPRGSDLAKAAESRGSNIAKKSDRSTLGNGLSPSSSEALEKARIEGPASENSIRRTIGVGMGIAEARRIMSKAGFTCSREYDADFTGKTKIHYLYCQIDEPISAGVGIRRKVAIEIRDEKVAQVLYTDGFVGP
jgi:hypothetical protein